MPRSSRAAHTHAARSTSHPTHPAFPPCSYSVKGLRNWSAALPAPITAMCRVLVRQSGTPVDCCAVALEGGEVRFYAQGALSGCAPVAQLTLQDTVTGMRFGQYGRESHTLVLASRSGALSFRILRRGAHFEGRAAAAASAAGAPPPAADEEGGGALELPKKSRLYVEQTAREREEAPDMHRAFQRDLCRLRLTTAKAYVKVRRARSSIALPALGWAGGSRRSLAPPPDPARLARYSRTGGRPLPARPRRAPPCASAPRCWGWDRPSRSSWTWWCVRRVAAVSAAPPRATHHPVFPPPTPVARPQNVGRLPADDVTVAFSFNPNLYSMSRPLSALDTLVPGLRYALDFDATALDAAAPPHALRCVLNVGQAATPCVSLLIAMPHSQPPLSA